MEFLPADCRTLIFNFVNPYDWDQLRTVSEEWNRAITELGDLHFAASTTVAPYKELPVNSLDDYYFEAAYEVTSKGVKICTVFKYNGWFLVQGVTAMPMIVGLTDLRRCAGMYFARSRTMKTGSVELFRGVMCRKGLAPGHIRDILKQL